MVTKAFNSKKSNPLFSLIGILLLSSVPVYAQGESAGSSQLFILQDSTVGASLQSGVMQQSLDSSDSGLSLPFNSGAVSKESFEIKFPSDVPTPCSGTLYAERGNIEHYHLGEAHVEAWQGPVTCADGTLAGTMIGARTSDENGESFTLDIGGVAKIEGNSSGLSRITLAANPNSAAAIDSSSAPMQGSEINGPNSVEAAPTEPACDANSATQYLDVLFAFTKEAKQSACAVRNASLCTDRYIAEDIALAVVNANRAFCDSFINFRVRPTGAVLAPESETDSNFFGASYSNRTVTHMSELALGIASGGFMKWLLQDPTSNFRHLYMADFVSLIVSDYTQTPSDGLCGAAAGVGKSSAASIVSRNCIQWHQFTRELGANLGIAADNTIITNNYTSGTHYTAMSSQGSQIVNRLPCITSNDSLQSGVHPVCCTDSNTCDYSPMGNQKGAALLSSLTNAANYEIRQAITRIVPSPPNPLSGGAEGYSCTWNQIAGSTYGYHTNCIDMALYESVNGDSVVVLPAPNAMVSQDRYYQHLMMGEKGVNLIGMPQDPEAVKISGNYPADYGEGNPVVLRMGFQWKRPTNFRCDAGGACTDTARQAEFQDPSLNGWPEPVISGFTFTGGFGESAAGGIWCIGGLKPHFTDNIIEGNSVGFGRGAGISWESCGGEISRNIIRNNTIDVTGPVIPNLRQGYNLSKGFDGRTSDWGGECFLRPNIPDTIGAFTYEGVSCAYDAAIWPAIPGVSKYGYIGGGGIRVSTNRNWTDSYPKSLFYAVHITDNIIYGNQVASNLVEFDTTGTERPTAVGAGIQLYGLPALIANNTIANNTVAGSASAAGTGSGTVYFSQDTTLDHTPTHVSYPSLLGVTAPMTGFGIGCIGSGVGNSVIVNNIIMDNGASQGQNVNNIDCAITSGFVGYNLTDGGFLPGSGGNVTGVDPKNIFRADASSLVVMSNLAMSRADLITNLTPKTSSPATDRGTTNSSYGIGSRDLRLRDYKNSSSCSASGYVDVGALEADPFPVGSCAPTGGGGGGNPTCFLAGTPILLDNGSTKPIEEIATGDVVRSYDTKTGTFIAGKVAKTFKFDAKRYLIVNGSLKVTPEHRMFSKGKWVQVGKLRIGDTILNKDGKNERITSLREVEENVSVYNFGVDKYHDYIAGGLVSHNRYSLVDLGC